MEVKTIKGKRAEQIENLVRSAETSGFHPTLAIIFLPNKEDIPAIDRIFDERGISIFGVSSFGQFIDKDHDTDSIVAMLLKVNQEDFRIEFRETGNSTTKEIARSIGEAAKTIFSKPAFIVASGGVKTDGEKIVEGIQEVAGDDASVFGGLAASDFQTMDTFIFTNGRYSNDGLVSIILNEGRISVNGYATGGSQPVGIYHTITKSDGNIVYSIDGEPALDMVLRYCGKGIDELKAGNTMLTIASYFQIQLQRENGSPIMRTPMYPDFENGSIVFAGSLPQGSKVKFSILPGFEVVDNVVNEFNEYRKNATAADAMILFSCRGREVAFGPWMSDEIERLREIWNVPMIGLFSFGEIGRGVDGKCEFYNMTCSAALLKERGN